MSTIAQYIKRSDVLLFHIFNNKLHCAILSSFMKYLTNLGSTAFSIILPAVLILSGKAELRKVGIFLAANLIISQLVVHLVKRLVNRPRPFKTLKNTFVINPPTCKYSFPSGHTCAAFSIAYSLSYFLPGFSVLFYSVALLVGISRIYLGAHYPTDVFIGASIAYLSFITSFRIPFI